MMLLVNVVAVVTFCGWLAFAMLWFQGEKSLWCNAEEEEDDEPVMMMMMPTVMTKLDDLRNRKCDPGVKIEWHGGKGFGGPSLSWERVPGSSNSFRKIMT